jgi:DnaJ-class molecular chaperone
MKILIDCPRCQGTGFVAEWGTCPDCEGQEKIEVWNQPLIEVDGLAVYKIKGEKNE